MIDDGELLLVLQVANLHHRRGGMWRPIEIGSVEAVRSKDIMENTYGLLLIGSFATMALYDLLLYYSGRGATWAPLYLALLFRCWCFASP